MADLLTAGFPKRSRFYWVTALARLSNRAAPDGLPKYGHMLESGNKAVGVVLLIFAAVQGGDGTTAVRCNFSSWYVDPAFRRLYASLLISHALKHSATFLNVSPADHTLPIIEAQGFRRFCDGVFAAVPALDLRVEKARVSGLHELAAAPRRLLPASDLALLDEHERFGCLGVWCEDRDGGRPFIFRRRFLRKLPLLPCAQLIYSHALDDVVRFAGPLGRFLALRGMPFMLVPANDPIPGLVGRYYGDKPMYFRGADRPRVGDLRYTEAALFGF